MTDTKKTPTELFDCDRVNAYLDSYLLDQVPPPERRGMRLHIHGCPSCHEKVTSRDPLQLFAPLADQTLPEDRWEGFWSGVRSGMARPRREGIAARAARWLEPAAWTPARAAGVIALAAALFAVPALMVVLRSFEPEAGRPLTARDPDAVTAPAPAAAFVRAGEARDPLPQTVEQVRTPDARPVQVYSMRYDQEGPVPQGEGADARVTELVLIVDAGLEL